MLLLAVLAVAVVVVFFFFFFFFCFCVVSVVMFRIDRQFVLKDQLAVWVVSGRNTARFIGLVQRTS